MAAVSSPRAQSSDVESSDVEYSSGEESGPSWGDAFSQVELTKGRELFSNWGKKGHYWEPECYQYAGFQLRYMEKTAP